MPKPSSLLIALILLTLGGPPTLAEDPSGGPITLDGELTAEEWRAGADQPVSEEGWARLSHRDDGLYIAVRSNVVAMVDVMVQRGDELHQLHVSGQVGGALFERGDDDLWRLKKTYPWYDKVMTEEEWNAHRAGQLSTLKKRVALRSKLAARAAEQPKTPPSPQGAPASAPSLPASPPSTPPAPSPSPSPPSAPEPADAAETVERHLEQHGWTGTLFGMGDSKTAELFLSKDFLKPGDRLLIYWPRRTADRPSATETFPADAAPMPEAVSAVYSTAPFAHDFANWYLVD